MTFDELKIESQSILVTGKGYVDISFAMHKIIQRALKSGMKVTLICANWSIFQHEQRQKKMVQLRCVTQ
jgi:hypothetical protein